MSVLAIAALSLAGCLEAAVTRCEDRLCPAGTECRSVLGCVLEEQVRACATLDDGAPCMYAGVTDGQCRNGACVAKSCGDGFVTDLEDCDAEGVVADCATLGFYDPGDVTCTPACRFDTTTCTGWCGDGELDDSEPCDPGALPATDDDLLDGRTCLDFGFYAEPGLACSEACTFVTTTCAHRCGDGILDATEDCDDARTDDPADDVFRGDCLDLGFYDATTIRCTSLCGYDTSACTGFCGDGVVDAGEDCDHHDTSDPADDVFGGTCLDLGFYEADTIACTPLCNYDDTSCTGSCGDAIVNGPEICEGKPPPDDTCVTIGFDLGLLGCSDFCTPGFASCERTGWHTIASYPLSFYFTDVWASSRNDVYLGSELGLFHWDGASIAPVFEITGEPYVFQVWGTGPNDVWAIADGVPYHYDGTTWTDAPLGAYVWAVGGTSATDVYVAGDSVFHREAGAWIEVYAGDGNAIAGTDADDVWIAGSAGAVHHYDGTAWTTLASPFTGGLFTVWVRGPDDVLVGGSDGLASYDGASWTIEHDRDVYAIWGSGPEDVHAAGSGIDGVFHYDGLGWSARPSPNLLDVAALWGVDGAVFEVGGETFLDRYDGATAAVMPSGTFANLEDVWGTSVEAFAVGAAGTIVHWNGRAWSAMTSGTTANLLAVWGASPDDVYAAGLGVLQHYDGTAWSTVQTGNFYGVWGSSSDDVYVTLDSNLVLHFDGNAWGNVTASTSLTRAIWGSGPDDVYVSRYLSTPYQVSHFDGSTWSTVPGLEGGKLHGSGPGVVVSAWGAGSVSRTARYDGTAVTDIDPGIVVGPGSTGTRPFRDVHVTGPADVLGVTDGGGIHHFDGVTWWPIDVATTEDLNAIDGARGTWWVVGDNGTIVLLTRDPGRSCTTAGAEATCDDGVDDDCDFLTDGEDPDCRAPGVCWGAVELACGAAIDGFSGGGAKTIGNYGCSRRHLDGGEDTYVVTPPASGNVHATLTGLTGSLDLFAVGATSSGACDPAGACLAASELAGTANESVTAPATAGEPVYVIVDHQGAFSAYTLTVTCD